jgi:hypothetical protein
VPNRDTIASWREVATGLIRGTTSAMSLISRARESNAEIVLVSSDLLSDALVSPEEATQLANRAAAEGLDVRIVVVVREQVGYINSLYCKRIMNLETARGLDEFAALATPAHRFDYVASFGAIADTPGLELVAIPYPELLAKGAGRAIVEAAAPTAPIPDSLGPSESAFDPTPGPVLLAATRLLHKRLRRLNAFHEQGKAPLRPYTQKLKERAEKAGWDTHGYWGWTPAESAAVQQEYSESNAAFAEFVWGSEWTEPAEEGRLNRADLPDLAPALLRGVLTTVDKLVQEAIDQPWLES